MYPYATNGAEPLFSKFSLDFHLFPLFGYFNALFQQQFVLSLLKVVTILDAFVFLRLHCLPGN